MQARSSLHACCKKVLLPLSLFQKSRDLCSLNASSWNWISFPSSNKSHKTELDVWKCKYFYMKIDHERKQTSSGTTKGMTIRIMYLNKYSILRILMRKKPVSCGLKLASPRLCCWSSIQKSSFFLFGIPQWAKWDPSLSPSQWLTCSLRPKFGIYTRDHF